MAQFPPALTYVLDFEDPRREYETVADNEGNVISGINSLAWPDQFAVIEDTPVADRAPLVAGFYQVHFWLLTQLGGLTSQEVANRVMDHEVNAGLKMGVQALQKALNLLHPGSVEVDGLLGPLTLQAANDTDPEALLAAVRTTRKIYYQEVVKNNPSDAPYLAEWLRRAAA